MQINPDDINRTKSSPLELFYQTIRADATKLDYDRKLRKLMCEILGPVLKGDPELVRKASEKPKPRRRGLKKSFCDADFEVRINQFVDLAKGSCQTESWNADSNPGIVCGTGKNQKDICRNRFDRTVTWPVLILLYQTCKTEKEICKNFHMC